MYLTWIAYFLLKNDNNDSSDNDDSNCGSVVGFYNVDNNVTYDDDTNLVRLNIINTENGGGGNDGNDHNTNGNTDRLEICNQLGFSIPPTK